MEKTRSGYLRDIMKLLGYSSERVYVEKNNSGRKQIVDYLRGSNNYALHFLDMDLPVQLGSRGEELSVYPSDVEGIWSFVFLDACSTGPNPSVENSYAKKVFGAQNLIRVNKAYT